MAEEQDKSTVKRVVANMDDLLPGESVRREVHEGVEHLVVPAVLIVEGVLNDALVLASEFGRHVESWNDRAIPVLHPQDRGEYISAGRPDVVEKNTIGRVYNARVDGGKLKAELWLNLEKARRLGHGDLVDALAAGEIIEISTGYFADDEPKAGEYNGVGYNTIHRNIRPDHLALLPGEIGACSVADGCGTRANSQKGFVMKTKEAFETLARAVGLRANCECQDGGDPMSAQERAEKIEALKKHLKANKVDQKTADAITANKKLSPEQVEMLMSLDAEQLKMAQAFAEALTESAGDGGESETMEGDEVPESMEFEEEESTVANNSQKVKTFTEQDVEKIVANQLRRQKVVEKLKANESCAFDDSDLKSMSIESLEKYEASIRPQDYSGAGGFATNSDAVDTNVTPLVPNSVMSRINAKKEA